MVELCCFTIDLGKKFSTRKIILDVVAMVRVWVSVRVLVCVCVCSKGTNMSNFN